MGSLFHIPYDKDLNDAQREAVMRKDGPTLVVAGAGSGKTRTLTYRVARLVEENISPESILLLTFTRKAAEQMLKRSRTLLDRRCEMVNGGTFHAFANKMLRRYADRIGYRNDFIILDRVDTESLIGMLRKGIGKTSLSRSFPSRRTLANIFSRSANKNMAVADIIYDAFGHFVPDLDAILSIYRQYTDHKIQHMFMDYDDLLSNFKMLLENQPEIRGRIGHLYRYIMVDEYQDTNQIQSQILYLMAEEHRNLMVVGDDSQSIYSFRGAYFENMMQFPEIFPEAHIVRLEENYRSTQPILDATNAIIGKATRKYTKHLFTRKTEGPVPILVYAKGENNQSKFVVDKIHALTRKGVPLTQIAVLFRAGFHSFDLEIELNKVGIPFIKIGGFKFMESAHIKDVLAHLRILINPQDRLSWQRILILLEGIGPKTVDDIYQSILKENSAADGLDRAGLKPRQRESITGLLDLYTALADDPGSVAQMGERVMDYYASLLEKHYDDHPKRMKDLEQLCSIMDRYGEIQEFLTEMALEPPNSSIGKTLAAETPSEDRLILSTIHSAKGLEWHTVFIIWALDGRFPSYQSLDHEQDVEEELRLMYVAATRACENLFFTCPGQIYDRITQQILDRPSRFIEDLPENLLERSYAHIERFDF